VNYKWKNGNSRWNEKGKAVMMEVSMSSTPRNQFSNVLKRLLQLEENGNAREQDGS
jgi:hypothetical protein